VTQLLSVSGGKLRQEGTFTLLCSLSLKRTSSGFSRSGVDRLGSGEYFQRRVFISNTINGRPWAA
jgi:hypothetical protein